MASNPVSAMQVGSYFVGQYYQVLQRQPELVHQFYNDASTMVMVDGDTSDTGTGMLQIHTLIMSLHITGIEIKTINSIESWNGGLLVMVSGSVKATEFSSRRKFVQTFFLAPQEKGYFVLSDIFHFTDDEEIIQQDPAPAFLENSLDSHYNVPTTVSEHPVSHYDLEEEAREFSGTSHVEDDPVDKYSIPDQQQQQEPEPEPETETVVVETPVEELSVSYQSVSYQDAENVMQDPLVAAALEEPVGEPPKKTYASILRAAKGQFVPPISSQAFSNTSASVTSEWDYTPQIAATSPLSNMTSSYVAQASLHPGEGGSTFEDNGEPKSVYVRNLPSNITAADIEQEFINFGRIKPDGVFIRNRQDVGVCYAFVEFEELSAVQNAIKASPIQLNGRQVYIEERRPNNSGAPRGGRRGRGSRGGYQTEVPRGRSRNFGRENNDSAADYRSKGNGYLHRSSQGF